MSDFLWETTTQEQSWAILLTPLPLHLSFPQCMSLLLPLVVSLTWLRKESPMSANVTCLFSMRWVGCYMCTETHLHLLPFHPLSPGNETICQDLILWILFHYSVSFSLFFLLSISLLLYLVIFLSSSVYPPHFPLFPSLLPSSLPPPLDPSQADKLLSMDYQHALDKLISFLPTDHQILLFSATFPVTIKGFTVS